MSLPFRSLTIPQCSVCIRSYAFAAFDELRIGSTGLGQQVRRASKKKAVVTSTVPVRLLKNVKSFGRKGAIVPVSMGRMRNMWFPGRVAEYVTLPEQRMLRLKNTMIERDFQYGAEEPVDPATLTAGAAQTRERAAAASMPPPPPMRRAPELERITPERSLQLLEIFVPQRLDFYRQPIVEEVKPEPEKPKRVMPNIGSGATAELFAARAQSEKMEEQAKNVKPQAIYGSVSTQNVLDAVKATLATNDESARVNITEEDVRFIETGAGLEEAGKVVKHVGDFTVEIRVKGAEETIQRLIKVHAQEA